MKKQVKKLKLAKETVQTLDSVSMEQARGASVTCPTEYGWDGCWSKPYDDDIG